MRTLDLTANMRVRPVEELVAVPVRVAVVADCTREAGAALATSVDSPVATGFHPVLGGERGRNGDLVPACAGW